MKFVPLAYYMGQSEYSFLSATRFLKCRHSQHFNHQHCRRLCLFGEHSDWAGAHRLSDPSIARGRTIVIPTEQGLHAKAYKLDAPVLEMSMVTETGDVNSTSLPLDLLALLAEARKGGFWLWRGYRTQA